MKITEKIGAVIRAVIALFKNIIVGNITLKQAFLEVEGWLIKKPLLGDDFNWNYYHSYYSEELKSMSKKYTLVLNEGDCVNSFGRIEQKNLAALPLHPNHQILYELIYSLNVKSVLEFGCGGGDHLRNLEILNHHLVLHGVDRSKGQIATLKNRHPDLKAGTEVGDITSKEIVLPSADLVYSHAVLMHISERDERFQTAVNNMLSSSNQFIVLIETWAQHNFLEAFLCGIANNSKWKNAKLYFTKSPIDAELRAMVISKNDTLSHFEPLTNYSQLILERKLRVH
jgi:SAM-dependent methyltransferase